MFEEIGRRIDDALSDLRHPVQWVRRIWRRRVLMKPVTEATLAEATEAALRRLSKEAAEEMARRNPLMERLGH